MVKTTKRNGWIWIHKKEFMEIYLSKNITGKYLFFSKNREKLIKLAKELIETFNLDLAKVPDDKNKVDDEWVLCIYDGLPKLTDEMAKYSTKEIFYRKWKSDENTRKGKYSEMFIKNLKTK